MLLKGHLGIKCLSQYNKFIRLLQYSSSSKGEDIANCVQYHMACHPRERILRTACNTIEAVIQWKGYCGLRAIPYRLSSKGEDIADCVQYHRGGHPSERILRIIITLRFTLIRTRISSLFCICKSQRDHCSHNHNVITAAIITT